MKNTNEKATKVATTTENTTAKAAKKNPATKPERAAVKYAERVRVAKSELQSISRLYRDLCEVYGDCLLGARFSDFRAYMRERYHMDATDKGTPRRGWSGHYACQFAERFIKDAISHPNCAAYVAARNYYISERAERQNAKSC